MKNKTKPNQYHFKGTKKVKFVLKPKQQHQRWQAAAATATATKRNWLDLPSDVTANILSRVGVFDILENVQKVCTTWYQICKDPTFWRVVSIDNSSNLIGLSVCSNVVKHVVTRSQGQLVDISMKEVCDKYLLQFIADRSPQLRRLEIIYGVGEMYVVWRESLKKLALLEELSLFETEFSDKDIKAAGRYCPLLTSLKVNEKPYIFCNDHVNDEQYMSDRNAFAVAIGKNLPDLRHLELIGNTMTNTGLKAILDGCRHLESLDLRQVLYIDLKGALGKRCSEQIKHLKLPHDSLEGFQYLDENVDAPCDVTSESDLQGYGDPFYPGFDYEDPDDDCDENDYVEDFILLHEAMAFMAMYRDR
uniref:putative F-box/LRR-repeat protein 23 n=1 Tax=Erigeron canadensis TaxID=72917 RepID=UPI001CB89CAB|nr:putative F-box/LRR-repeat protein 23 [Erigeron canadensis]